MTGRTARTRTGKVIERRPASEEGSRRFSIPGVTRERVFLVLSPVAVLLIWELFSRSGVLDIRIFSAPTRVAVILYEMAIEGELFTTIGATFVRFLIGTTLGVVPGLILGLIIGLFRTPRAVVNPLVALTYPLPRIALFPLVLLIFGLNETSYRIMVALAPFFAMLISTDAGVRDIPPIYLRVGQSFNTSNVDQYRLVVLPAALPTIYGGFRLAVGMGLFGVMAVEFLSADSGIGFLIWHSWQILDLAASMAGLVMAGALGYAVYQVLDIMERRLIPWAQN